MDTLIKLNNQSAGRDKLARLLQYGSRALWYYMQQMRMSHQNVEKFRSLEFTFSSFRKLLRLGRCIDTFYGSLTTINYPDTTVRVTTTLSRISLSIYLLADHLLWIGRTGLLSVNNDKWGRVANKYWMYAIIMNVLRDLYEILRIVRSRQGTWPNMKGAKVDQSELRKRILVCIHEHKDVLVDTVKNASDLFIPMTALGFINLKPGTVGVLGVISSAAAILSLIDPLAKLSPS